MVPPDRPPPEHLSFLAGLGEKVRRGGLFSLVRQAEARAPGLPRLGTAKRPSQNIVDLTAVPHLSFPARTIEAVEVKGGRAKVSGYWLGLTGPMGPLPTHLTEYATYERRYGKTRPFGDWLDVLAGRMLQFFYRSWAESQPAAQADRPDSDRFADYLAALSGAAEGVEEGADFPARARLHYAGLFAGRRSAGAIEDGLTHLLGVRARVIEFQPRWRSIEEQDQSRLGRSFARLGDDLVIGKRVRVASDAFRIAIKVDDLRQFEALLPSGARFPIAAEAIDAFAPSHLEWDLTLEIDQAEVPAARLDGRCQLGWTGWLQPRPSHAIRADAHLSRSRRKTKPRKGTIR